MVLKRFAYPPLRGGRGRKITFANICVHTIGSLRWVGLGSFSQFVLYFKRCERLLRNLLRQSTQSACQSPKVPFHKPNTSKTEYRCLSEIDRLRLVGANFSLLLLFLIWLALKIDVVLGKVAVL
ncbi:hypothetical protein D3C87_184780 [compost metagenome]